MLFNGLLNTAANLVRAGLNTASSVAVEHAAQVEDLTDTHAD